MVRLKLHLKGVVQGMGFRPFVYRTAKGLGLKGYVINDTAGVFVEIEGLKDNIDRFLCVLNYEKPSLADIYYQEAIYEEPVGYDDFEIRPSTRSEHNEVVLLPDIATCKECIEELTAHNDRRFGYPFINCTSCGPRFTIIEKLPYDRSNTTMKGFQMCPACHKEHNNPSNRRFHAQPNACPDCGPNISLLKDDGTTIPEGQGVIEAVFEKIKDGSIVAIKGIGGFHLVCDATNDSTVALLRKRKGRPDKPFAVMFRDMEQVKEYAEPTELEESILILPSRPIVLVKKKKGLLDIASPHLNSVGVFLPYSPLHYIILKGLDFPVVATSGNLSQEPIVKENDEALKKLSPISHFILLHNRPIHRRCDDSVVKVVGGYPQIIRRSRGYAPLPITLPFRLTRRILAVGGHQKNTFAIGFEDRIIVSQHISDMETIESMEYFEEAIDDLSFIYKFEPDIIVHDLHPGYETTRWAIKQKGIEKIAIQHHYAHILSCMAENGLNEKVIGVAWDGTGYGEDGTLWGGEFLTCDSNSYERAFHLKPFRLIGGEKAVREPRRIALSILFELFNDKVMDMDIPLIRGFKEKELAILWIAWQKKINSPLSSSAGRLFDALASFLGILQVCTYEAQAAMMIEDLFDPNVKDYYSYNIKDGEIDWVPTFHDLFQDSDKAKVPTRFINTLSRIILEVVSLIGEKRVCLSGGVFQNSPLCGIITEELQKKGFLVYTQKLVPANDGGISLGQAFFGGMS